MPAEIVSDRIVPSRNLEVVSIMDDYGTEFSLSLAVGAGDARQPLIDAAVADHTARETALTAYAAAHGIDMTAQLADGLAKKARAKAGFGQ